MSLGSEGLTPNTLFMEKFIDRQIDHFVEETESDLARLQQAGKKADRCRLLWSKPPDPREDLVQSCLEAFKEIDDAAGDVRSRIGPVLIGLDSREDLPAEFEEEGPTRALEQLDFLIEHLDKAVERVRAYFIRPTNTVSVGNLQKENMMIYLHWAEEVAGRLRDRVEDEF